MKNKYQPTDSLKVPRFCDVRTFMRLPNLAETEGVDVAVVGVPFDTASTYRTGSRFGPAAIRDMSMTIRPYNLNLGILSFDFISAVDYGDIPVVPGYIEETYARIETFLSPIIMAGVIPICLGGDHSITLPELRAIAKKHGPVALVHFDSHTDTVESYFDKPYNHGTPFYHAAKEGLLDTAHSIQAGMRGNLYSADALKDSENLGFAVLPAREMHKIGMHETARRIRERVGDAKAFLSFDIDFVDPAYAPGTGTIEVGGFTSYETLELLSEVKDLNYVGFDLVEVSPPYDSSEITANLAANIAHDFVAMVARQKMREKKEGSK